MISHILNLGINRNAVCRSVAVVHSKNKDSLKAACIHSAQIIVGTSCAGTGLDNGAIGHVVIVGLPFSIEQLLQWAGRCRKDGNVTLFIPSSHMVQSNELTSEHRYDNVVDS